MSGEFQIMTPDEDGWSEWIHPLPGYLMKCCDCGLVHEMQVAITIEHDAVSVANEGEDKEHVVVFRMRRA
jgi:Zn-finger protein